MLTLYMIDHEVNVQIHVQILWSYLQLVHFGNQSNMILGLDHHQPSSKTPFVSYVLFDKN